MTDLFTACIYLATYLILFFQIRHYHKQKIRIKDAESRELGLHARNLEAQIDSLRTQLNVIRSESRAQLERSFMEVRGTQTLENIINFQELIARNSIPIEEQNDFLVTPKGTAVKDINDLMTKQKKQKLSKYMFMKKDENEVVKRK